MKKLLLSIFLTLNLFANQNEFYLGDTFDFAENDALEDIKNHILNNKDKINKKLETYRKSTKEKVKNFKPKDLIPLTPANKDYEFWPTTPTRYTQQTDIKDNDGKIIYPKGFTFNPLDFVNMPYEIVVIDATLPNQIKWLEEQNYINNIKYKILISDGNYMETQAKIKQPVQYLLGAITERFELKHTPCLISQFGNKIRVKEFCLTCKDKK